MCRVDSFLSKFILAYFIRQYFQTVIYRALHILIIYCVIGTVRNVGPFEEAANKVSANESVLIGRPYSSSEAERGSSDDSDPEFDPYFVNDKAFGYYHM